MELINEKDNLLKGVVCTSVDYTPKVVGMSSASLVPGPDGIAPLSKTTTFIKEEVQVTPTAVNAPEQSMLDTPVAPVAAAPLPEMSQPVSTPEPVNTAIQPTIPEVGQPVVEPAPVAAESAPVAAEPAPVVSKPAPVAAETIAPAEIGSPLAPTEMEIPTVDMPIQPAELNSQVPETEPALVNPVEVANPDQLNNLINPEAPMDDKSLDAVVDSIKGVLTTEEEKLDAPVVDLPNLGEQTAPVKEEAPMQLDIEDMNKGLKEDLIRSISAYIDFMVDQKVNQKLAEYYQSNQMQNEGGMKL